MPRSLSKLAKSKTTVFEDVSAAQVAHQVIVATLGDVISAKRVVAGVGATPVQHRFRKEYSLTTSTESTSDDKHEQVFIRNEDKASHCYAFHYYLGPVSIYISMTLAQKSNPIK
jgi:hypothetical protein